MGTWSHEPFGNDIASDWAYEFEENDGYEVIKNAFDQIIDADIGCIAHAAAEVLAKSFTDGGTKTNITLNLLKNGCNTISISTIMN